VTPENFLYLFIGANWNRRDHDLVRLAMFITKFPKKKDINEPKKKLDITNCDDKLPPIPDVLKTNIEDDYFKLREK